MAETQAYVLAETLVTKDKESSRKEFDFPLGVQLANKLLSKYANKTLDAEELIERAMKKSGLKDFGTTFWKKPMLKAFEDINANTEFHPLGAYLYEQKVIQNLQNRLWAQYWIKQDPSITQELPPAVMITGLQRTGTTFMQRLLGALPEFRGVMSWEIVNPVPTGKSKKYHGKTLSYFGHKALNYINPDFKAIHSLDHNSLDEEVALMEHCFMSSIIEAVFNTPNYSKWLEEQDQKPAYRDLKMWLQLLLWREPAQRFLLLKSPHHMEYLDDFSAVFPGTKFVHMHRDPKETMASYCSMMHYAKKMFQPYSNPHDIGQHWLKKNKRLVEKCEIYKSDHQDQFIDIRYKDLVKDPIAVARRIYEELNLTWTDEHTKAARDYYAQHRKNKYGKHVYSLADYGLTPGVIEQQFSAYYDRYQHLL